MLLGRRVVEAEDVVRPWATGVRTRLATLDDGSRVVLQLGRPTAEGRAGIARRIRLAGRLWAVTPRLPVPEVLAGDARAPVPFVVTRFVAGEPGNDLFATARGAASLGRAAGAVALEIAACGGQRLRLSRRWAEPARLAAAAAGWLDEASPLLGAGGTGAAARVVGRAAEHVAAAPPVLAHGDLAPVNLVIAGGRVVGLLDLERMRLAPPLFDAAWFRLIVRHHHPERWPDVGPALMEARGLADDVATVATLDDLGVLACLEQVATLPRSSAGRRAWADRATEILAR